jgi:hypothetical protein
MKTYVVNKRSVESSYKINNYIGWYMEKNKWKTLSDEKVWLFNDLWTASRKYGFPANYDNYE